MDRREFGFIMALRIGLFWAIYLQNCIIIAKNKQITQTNFQVLYCCLSLHYNILYGEIRPQYSVLKQKVEDGFHDQILFSEFSRLDRKPSNSSNIFGK